MSPSPRRRDSCAGGGRSMALAPSGSLPGSRSSSSRLILLPGPLSADIGSTLSGRSSARSPPPANRSRAAPQHIGSPLDRMIRGAYSTLGEPGRAAPRSVGSGNSDRISSGNSGRSKAFKPK